MRLRSSIAVLVLAGLSASAWAQQGPAPQSPEQRAERFDAADSNQDGKLEKAEFIASLPERAQGFGDQIWERVDADGDGEVTREQFVNLEMRRPG